MQIRAKSSPAVLAGVITVLAILGVLALCSAAQAAPKASSAAVLIGFNHRPGAADEDVVKGHLGQIKHRFDICPVIAADVPESQLQALSEDPDVAYIEPDGIAVGLEDALPWGVNKIEADQVWGGYDGAVNLVPGDLSGSGVKVAVIDSGVDYTHPDIAPDYAGGYNFVAGTSDPRDDNGHGTHVAGIICAADDGANVIGVAPQVRLYALKALDASGFGSYSNIIAAMQWCINNGIQVINMSLGGSASTSMKTAVQACGAANIVVVAAAGNSGAGTDTVLCPAMYAPCIAVAATDINDVRCSWSSTGPEVQLAAPGNVVLSDRMGGGTVTMSGTSMASPHVAALAALLIQGGILDAAAVAQRMDATAVDLGTAGRDNYYGYGRIDALAACLNIASAPAPAPDPTPSPSPTKGNKGGGGGSGHGKTKTH